MSNRWFGLIICMLFTLYGCTKSVKFVNFTNIDSQQWQRNDSKNFMFRNQSSHTVGDLYLCINYINLDINKNIEIDFEVQSPTKKIWTTKYTVSLEPTDRVGKIDNKKEIKLIEGCEFSDIGVYRFKVSQSSLPTLSGITSIGIAIK